METVSLLKNSKGQTIAVFASSETAFERADRYNADPFKDDGSADEDAPYSVETFTVCEV